MRIMTTLSDDALDNLQIFITGLSTHKPYTYVFVDNLHHEIKAQDLRDLFRRSKWVKMYYDRRGNFVGNATIRFTQ